MRNSPYLRSGRIEVTGNINYQGLSSEHPPSVSTTWIDMVRLISHNLLACHVKGCHTNNFPLRFANARVELKECDFNPEFLKAFLPKIEWSALVGTARQVSAMMSDWRLSY